jgi:hypothetical protein
VSKIKRLLQSYASHIQVPWREVAAAQRVIFCVYPQADELRLRVKIDEFELATKNAGHGWEVFDLTDTFARWLTSGRYAEKWFKQPQLIASILPKYQDYLVAQFLDFLAQSNPSDNDAVALTGVGSLFGFLKVRDVVQKLSGLVHGRLVVFFPGSFEDNNYRLLDGYDGWNYLATPITPDKDTT